MQWLRMGWNDMRENLGASLSYGVILAVWWPWFWRR